MSGPNGLNGRGDIGSASSSIPLNREALSSDDQKVQQIVQPVLTNQPGQVDGLPAVSLTVFSRGFF